MVHLMSLNPMGQYFQLQILQYIDQKPGHIAFYAIVMLMHHIASQRRLYESARKDPNYLRSDGNGNLMHFALFVPVVT